MKDAIFWVACHWWLWAIIAFVCFFSGLRLAKTWWQFIVAIILTLSFGIVAGYSIIIAFIRMTAQS